MVKSVFSVFWEDHINELVTIYRSLFENNLLVDCTISAEGQSIKAHRLVLAASSPYFNMLLCEGIGNDPLIILMDESFETLKAVIDFVYRGETHIPEGNVEAFLTLAQSLQIKGLDAFTKDYMNKNVSNNPTEFVVQGPFEDNQGICKVESISSIPKDSLENYVQQYLHPLECFPDAEHTNSSDLCGEHSALYEEGQPSQEYDRLSRCREVAIETEITMKDEPLCVEFSEKRNEILDNIISSQPKSEGTEGDINDGTFFQRAEQAMNQYSSGSESSLGNMESSDMLPSEQPLMQLSKEDSSGQCIAEEDDPLLPVILDPKSEWTNDEESEGHMDDPEEPGNDVKEKDEVAQSALREHVANQCSGQVEHPSEQDEAVWSGGRWRRRRPQEGETSSPSGLQVNVGRHSRKQFLRCTECPATFASANGLKYHKRSHTGESPYSCNDCTRAFSKKSSLDAHMRMHTGKRLVSCEVCGNAFSQKSTLAAHMRTHTGERPFSCEVCGKTFSQKPYLTAHMCMHTGELLFICEVCGKAFSHKSPLAIHMRTHTGERPWSCEVCGKAFSHRSPLATHMRTHTGERPWSCEVCGKAFSQKTHLARHMHSHTGERPYSCKVCGKAFSQKSTLANHMHTHTGERPCSCEVCGKAFSQKSTLANHMRMHTGERPCSCVVCGKAFRCKSHLAAHMRTHQLPRKGRLC